MTREQKRKVMLALVLLWIKVLDYQVEQLLKNRCKTCDEWDELKHPRKANGQFGKGESTKNSSQEQVKHDIIQSMERFDFDLGLFGVDYTKMKKSQIEKSVRSLQKRIEEHKKMIEHPSRYVTGWDDRSEEYKTGIVIYWQREIERYSIQKREAEDYLAGRGKK